MVYFSSAFALALFLVQTIFASEELGFRSFFGNQNNENQFREPEKVDTPALPISQITWDTLETLSEKDGDNLDKYEAPFDFHKRYVYYLTGYDNEDRPSWMAEGGKWNIMEAVKDGQTEELNTYLMQVAYRIIKSIRDQSARGKEVSRASFVLDFDALAFEQLRHIPTVTFLLGVIRDSQHLMSKYASEIMIINANFATETFLTLAKPALGNVFGDATVYGTNKAVWLPRLLRMVPKKYIPEWYGGEKGYKPIKVYGR